MGKILSFKKVTSLVLSIMLVITLVIPASAETNVQSSDDPEGLIQMMVNDGLTLSQAEQIHRVGLITKKMNGNGQTIDLVDSNGQIIDSVDSKEQTIDSVHNKKLAISKPNISKIAITKDDEEFLINAYSTFISKPHKSHEEKVKEIHTTMEQKPGRSKYKITYDDGSFIQATSTLERVDEIKDSTVRINGNYHYPNEVEVGSGVDFSDGTYNHNYQLSEAGSLYWCTAQIGVNYTASNGNRHTKINDYGPDQHSDGTISISNSNSGCTVSTVDYNVEPTTWCSTYNQVTYFWGGSGSLSLGGVFGISVNAGHTWAETVITRESLITQHDYAAHD